MNSEMLGLFTHMCSAPLHIPVWQCDPKQNLEASSQIATETHYKLLSCRFPICKAHWCSHSGLYCLNPIRTCAVNRVGVCYCAADLGDAAMGFGLLKDGRVVWD